MTQHLVYHVFKVQLGWSCFDVIQSGLLVQKQPGQVVKKIIRMKWRKI